MSKGKGLAILLVSVAAPCLGVSLVLPPDAWAHHGRDFLLARTAELPDPGQLYLIPRQDYIAVNEESEFEFEPTFLAGVTPWLAVELHGHIAKEEDEPGEYESTAPAVQFRLSPSHHRWALGLSAEYEISHLDEIHDRLEVRGLLSASIRRSRLAINIAAERELDSGQDLAWGYAAGFRRRLTDDLDWGVEGQGTLERNSVHEGLIGLFYDVTDRLAVNAGVGTGTGDEAAPDFTSRTAVVWRLRG